MEARGWSDGLPLVPPTPERVARMLAGTTRDPDDVVAVVPPDLVECTVEKAAANAVLAGCTPEYLPVVLAAVEAACTDEFNIHGVLATTMPVGPVVDRQRPRHTRDRDERRWQHARAGEPRQRDDRSRAPAGHPKRRRWAPRRRRPRYARPPRQVHVLLRGGRRRLTVRAAARRAAAWLRGQSAVTLFAGEGPRVVVDQLSRDPDSLSASFAACLRTVAHPKTLIGIDAMLVVSPEHGRVFREARMEPRPAPRRAHGSLQVEGKEFVRGAGGIAEGMPEAFADHTLPKFRDGGLIIAYAGGGAGLFSAIIGGWAGGAMGSTPVTKEVGT